MKRNQLQVLAFIGVVSLAACSSNASRGPAAQGAGAPPLSADGGLPPPKSAREGVILPSDTGLGATPSGRGPTTGTSGGTVGPSMGNPPPGGGN